MKKIIGLLKDWTSLATGLIIGILALQVVLVREGVILYWLEGLCKSNDANDLYLAMLGAAASQASSAGVVVVFGLSAQPQAFRSLRNAAGRLLVNNWMSISYSGFLSAGCALAATLINMLGDKWFSPWFLRCQYCFAHMESYVCFGCFNSLLEL